jgi:carbonic anhydrase
MTLDVLRHSPAYQCRIPQSFVSHIWPAIESQLRDESRVDIDTLTSNAISANIVASVNQLRHGSELLQRLFRKEGLLVVGAEYSVETGVVEFLHSTKAV